MSPTVRRGRPAARLAHGKFGEGGGGAQQESLIDVDDVALGHSTRLTWNSPDAWIRSDTPAHPALVDRHVFEEVALRLAARDTTSSRTSTARTRRPYALRGLLTCAACERRMQGTWNHDRAHYRCRFPHEYAIANRIDHPLAAYVREDAVLGPLDEWLAGVLAPDRMRKALAALAEQQTGDDHVVSEAERQLAECDRAIPRRPAVEGRRPAS
jgi:site-specific DNA recombinase